MQGVSHLWKHHDDENSTTIATIATIAISVNSKLPSILTDAAERDRGLSAQMSHGCQ